MNIEERLHEIENTLRFLSDRIHGLQSRNLVDMDVSTNIQSKIFVFDHGDTMWMMFSSAIVLLMTLPGIALFYGGLIPNAKSFVAAGIQTLCIATLITVLWLTIGYSLSFGNEDSKFENSFFGDMSKVWLRGLSLTSVASEAKTIPESVFCTFQLGFAIIAAALVTGGFTDRIRFKAFLVFIALWHLIVYCPLAYSFWSYRGFFHDMNVLDFAGGNVVHISAGITALVSSKLVGKSIHSEKAKYSNLTMSFVGAGLLWLGWYGFNGGSAQAANASAGIAILNTQMSASSGAISWFAVDYIHCRSLKLSSMLFGLVSGLVAITPAAGYIDPGSALLLGLLSGPICWLSCRVTIYLGVDDSLDTFGIHCAGGIVGGLWVGIFARRDIGGVNGAAYGEPKQLLYQIYGILFSCAWSGIGSFLILMFVHVTIGLRAKVLHNRVGVHHSNSEPSRSITSFRPIFSPVGLLRASFSVSRHGSPRRMSVSQKIAAGGENESFRLRMGESLASPAPSRRKVHSTYRNDNSCSNRQFQLQVRENDVKMSRGAAEDAVREYSYREHKATENTTAATVFDNVRFADTACDQGKVKDRGIGSAFSPWRSSDIYSVDAQDEDNVTNIDAPQMPATIGEVDEKMSEDDT